MPEIVQISMILLSHYQKFVHQIVICIKIFPKKRKVNKMYVLRYFVGYFLQSAADEKQNKEG